MVIIVKLVCYDFSTNIFIGSGQLSSQLFNLSLSCQKIQIIQSQKMITYGHPIQVRIQNRERKTLGGEPLELLNTKIKLDLLTVDLLMGRK